MSYEKADFNMIPEHMIDGIKLYIQSGIPPGSFMEAIICNDLKTACAKADNINRYRIFDIVNFCYNYFPSQAWGSNEAYEAWVEHRGLAGIQ